MMIALFAVLATVLLIPALIWSLYLTVLVLAAAWEHVTRRLDPKNPSPEALATTRFCFLIPAHNEEKHIARTVESIHAALAQSGVAGFVCVVADNCGDATAKESKRVGAMVLERNDTVRRGKGFALAHGFDRLRRNTAWTHLVVVDADTVLDPEMPRAFASAFAEGNRVLQSWYQPLVSERSWRTDLIEVAWSVFNFARPLGRTVLGSTAGIYGNGFGLTRDTIERYPFRANGLVEDAEQALELLVEGIKVRFVRRAIVRGCVEASANASRSQRTRWESGRFQLAAAWIGKLAQTFRRERRPALVESMLDLATPPFALVTVVSLLALGMAAALMNPWLLAGAGSALLLQTSIVVLSAILAGRSGRLVRLPIQAPRYVAWKMGIYLTKSFWTQKTWVRTKRLAREAQS